MKTALVIVDVQHDFLPGGSLGVPDGDRVLDPIVRLADHSDVELIAASRDWHPANHSSFAEFGGIWPAHCVADTPGAEIHPKIAALNARTISKGLNPSVEEYSAAGATTLVSMLRAEGFDRVFVTGLATDYCVKATALDLLSEGFAVIVPRDCVAGVNVNEGDSEAALMEIAQAGGEVWHSAAN